MHSCSVIKYMNLSILGYFLSVKSAMLMLEPPSAPFWIDYVSDTRMLYMQLGLCFLAYWRQTLESM